MTLMCRKSRSQYPAMCQHGNHGNPDLNLQETAGSTRESLLEKFKSIVVIQDLDGICKCKHFHLHHLLVFGPFFLLRLAIDLQICKELLALLEILLSVLQIILLLSSLHCNLANASSLCFDGLGQSINFLCFCCHKAFKFLNGCGLSVF